MSKFIFRADITEDIDNWLDVFTGKGTSYGVDWRARKPADISLKCAGDKNCLKKYLSEKYYKKGGPQKYAEFLDVALDQQYIESDLLELTGYKIPFKKVLVVPTTFRRCPYNAEEGMFYISYGTALGYVAQVCYHETMHFIIHKYFWDNFTNAGLTDSQAHDIKEALTVLLNPYLEKRGIPKDEGYKSHSILREEILAISRENRDLENIISVLLESKAWLKWAS
jgi:hypothetical protein